MNECLCKRRSSAQKLNIIIICNVFKTAHKLAPVNGGHNGHHKQWYDDAAVTNDGAKIINGKSNGEQNGKGEKQAKQNSICRLQRADAH
jgi:hypothetical protein